MPPDASTSLDLRAKEATSEAAQDGADISFTLLDRTTGRVLKGGDDAPFPVASVSKLFIADDLLLQVAKGQRQLTTDEQQSFDAMLRSSDDSAAEVFWGGEGGGSAIISRVTARYGLTSTSVPYDGNWWNTMSTTADLVRYYDMLLDGAGGLPASQASVILGDLSASTPTGVDGYPQRFGIPRRAVRGTRCGQAGLDVLLERRQLAAHVYRGGDRTGSAFRACHGLTAAG